MLSAISDTMREYLPNCPAKYVNQVIAMAKQVVNQEDLTLTDSSSFLYGEGKKFSFQLQGQFRKNAAVYLTDATPPSLSESDTFEEAMNKLFEVVAKAGYFPSLPRNRIKLVIDDGTDKLKVVVDKCIDQVRKTCSNMKWVLGGSEQECLEAQFAERCAHLSPKTEMVYEGYMKGAEFCESLEVNGVLDVVEKCVLPTKELEGLPLLSEVCTWDPPKYLAPKDGQMTSTEQLFFTAVAAGSVYLAINRFRKEGVLNKVAGVALSAIGIGSCALLLKFA